jgi:hypothetical protein
LHLPNNHTIDGFNVQDRAVQESMGRIVDRSREHLGPADGAVIQRAGCSLIPQPFLPLSEGRTVTVRE